MKILTVVGARPQFIKAATVSRVLNSDDTCEEVLLHTGQHFDAEMSDVFFSELGMSEPNYSLNIHGGGHGRMTGRMLEAIEDVIDTERPSIVLVYGDTNSTLAGAVAAAKLHVPIAHIEAGLRSFNRKMPEEINRVLTDHVSEILFCPTTTAVTNLTNEGIAEHVYNVGDVMYDASVFAALRIDQNESILDKLGLKPNAYVLCTLHRAENTDDKHRFGALLNLLQKVASEHSVVFPIHPRTRKAMEEHGFRSDGLTVIDPVGYLDMNALLAGAKEVYTDSGGLQKEAYFHRCPCVTLRDETEWVETIEAGWNRLWTQEKYEKRTEIKEYGDGDSAQKIVEILRQWYTGQT